MRISLFALAICGFLFLLNSCTHYYYMPNSMVVPAIQKQHDAVISVAFCDFKGKEFQAIYSPLKYTALMYNYMNIPGPSQDKEASSWGRGQIKEGGLGLYYGNYPWTVSLFGGMGKGIVKNSYQDDDIFNTDPLVLSQLHFKRWFVQPSFVLQNRIFRAGFAVRHNWLNYERSVIDIRLQQVDAEEFSVIQRIERESPFKFVEVGFSIGFRIRPFTFSYNTVRIVSQINTDALHFASKNHNFMFTFDLYELWRWKDTLLRKRKSRSQETPPIQD